MSEFYQKYPHLQGVKKKDDNIVDPADIQPIQQIGNTVSPDDIDFTAQEFQTAPSEPLSLDKGADGRVTGLKSFLSDIFGGIKRSITEPSAQSMFGYESQKEAPADTMTAEHLIEEGVKPIKPKEGERSLSEIIQEAYTPAEVPEYKPEIEKIPAARKEPLPLSNEMMVRQLFGYDPEEVDVKIGAKVPREEGILTDKGGFLQQYGRSMFGSAAETGLSVAETATNFANFVATSLLPEEIGEKTRKKIAKTYTPLFRKVQDWKGHPESPMGYLGSTVGGLAEFVAEMAAMSALFKSAGYLAPKYKSTSAGKVDMSRYANWINKIPAENKLGSVARFVTNKMAHEIPVFASVEALRKRGGADAKFEGALEGTKMALLFGMISAVPGKAISSGALLRYPLGQYLLGTDPKETIEIMRNPNIPEEEKATRLIDVAVNAYFSRHGWTNKTLKQFEGKFRFIPQEPLEKRAFEEMEVPVEKEPPEVAQEDINLEKIEPKEKIPEPLFDEISRDIIENKILTTSGREIELPPKIRTESKIKTSNDIKNLNKWLVDESIKEAESRNDEYNLEIFRLRLDIDKDFADGKLTPGDKNYLNQYMFGETNPVFTKRDQTPKKETTFIGETEYPVIRIKKGKEPIDDIGTPVPISEAQRKELGIEGDRVVYLREGEPVNQDRTGGLIERKPSALGDVVSKIQMVFETDTPEKIAKTSILQWAEKAFGVPIKSKATHRWKKAGMYYPFQQIVRMQRWGDLSTMAHEIMHHVDKTLGKELGNTWKTDMFSPTAQLELKNLDYDQKKKRIHEGLAEYMRYYLTTNEAPNVAPMFHREFTENILSNRPELAGKFNELKRMMDVWQKQGAQNRILEQVDFKKEHTSPKGIRAKADRLRNWFNVEWRDEFHPVKRLVEEVEKKSGTKLAPTKSPAEMATYYAKKAGAVAHSFVMDKAVNEYGDIVGKSLREIIAPVKRGEFKDFITYAIAKRAKLIESKGKESGFRIEDADYILDKYKDRNYDPVVNDITKWSDNLLDWLIRSGGLGNKEAAMIRRLNPVYLPFMRAFMDSSKGEGGGSKFVNTGQVVKKQKGSGRPIINPIESLIAQARNIILHAQRTKIASLVAELGETQEGIGGLVAKVPAPAGVKDVPIRSIKDFKKYLAEMGIPEEELREMDMDRLMTVFIPESRYYKENIVSIWRDGKRQFYELDKDLYNTLMGLDSWRVPPLLRWASSFARLLRLGATGLKASFGLIRNPGRDFLTAGVYSKNRPDPLAPFKGLGKAITQTGMAPRFGRTGGKMSGMVGLDRAHTMRTYDELLSTRLGKKGKVLRVVKHPINALRDVLSITEQAPRIAELEKSMERLRKEHPEWSEDDVYVRAFNEAQDITLNFTRGGRTAKKINEFTAFFNAAVLGVDKFARAMKENPVGTTVKSIAYLTLPALALWYKNKDEEWYKNLPLAYKYSNFFIETDDDAIIRLPIPFDLGIVFTALPIASIDALYYDNPKAVNEFMAVAMSQMPDWQPSAIAPTWDVASNKNWIGSPIESEGERYQYVTERMRSYTSDIAKYTSKGLDYLGIKLSPIQIDYLIDAYTGGIRKQFKASKGKEAADLPVLGDIMLRSPEQPRRQLNEFFSDYELLSSKQNSDITTPDESARLSQLRPVYNMVRDYIKQLKVHREEENEADTKRVWGEIKQLLEYVGY